MDIREEMSGETGKHHWYKGPKCNLVAASEEGDDIRGRSKTQELHLRSLKILYEARAQTVEFGVVKRESGLTPGRTNQRKMTAIHLDRLAEYQGAARDERP
jgi:hypothetical protein